MSHSGRQFFMLRSLPTEKAQEAVRKPRGLVTMITSWRTARPFQRNTKKYCVAKVPPSSTHCPYL